MYWELATPHGLSWKTEVKAVTKVGEGFGLSLLRTVSVSLFSVSVCIVGGASTHRSFSKYFIKQIKTLEVSRADEKVKDSRWTFLVGSSHHDKWQPGSPQPGQTQVPAGLLPLTEAEKCTSPDQGLCRQQPGFTSDF